MQALVFLGAAIWFAFCVYNSAWLEPLPSQRQYVFVLTLCVLGAVAFASGRLSFALVLTGALFFGLKFIAVMKLRYLESPLMPADLVYYARDSLVETLAQYPHLARLSIGLCIAIPLMLWLVWHFDIRILPALRRWWQQAALRLIGTAACVLGLWWCMQPTGPFAPMYKADLWSKLSGEADLTNFFVNIDNMRPSLPAMSDAATARRDWASTTPAARANDAGAGVRPDIIQVLEESTFDPGILAGCTVEQCKAAMFKPDEYTRAHGPLLTHTFGGGTWASEFTMLSGMPQDIFGPAGMYAPFVLAPRLRTSLPMRLRELGYLTIAVYPVGGNFLNARNAYESYGFDRFYDIHDLGLEMWHSSDAQLFAAAKKVYDENRKAGKPIFLVILTLEQHGPHDGAPLKELPAPFDRGLQADLPADQDLNLSAYLARLQASDAGMTQLERDFLHRPHPTVLMHFGDHQPSFNGLIRKMAHALPATLEPYSNNLTYFMLKSNFDSPVLPQYPVLDIAYLPAMVLRSAGLSQGAYFSALSRLEERCQGLYTDCRNPALLASYHAWIFDHLQVYQ